VQSSLPVDVAQVSATSNTDIDADKAGRHLRESIMLSRRLFLGGFGCAALGCAASRRRPSPSLAASPAAVDAIESRLGGRVGLFAIATDSGKTLAHLEDERFALCSTFKWVLAAAVLTKVDENRLALEQQIQFGPADIIDYAPVTSKYVHKGRLSVEELARAAVVTSDNTAANLLLARLGGPAALTDFLRAHGDGISRLDRNEPTLNTNLPGDPRDTTSPRAMVTTLATLLTTDALFPASQKRLIEWMLACETGKERLRAGLPPQWRVGDKSGTGDRGAANDVVIAWPPHRGPILIAAYLSDSASPPPLLNVAHAELGQLVAQELNPDER
jgi:beta-lactamase class A